MLSIEEIIQVACKHLASDVHIVSNMPIRYRIQGELIPLSYDVVSEEDVYVFVKDLLEVSDTQMQEIKEKDFALTVCKHRLRLNVYRQKGTFALAIRIFQDVIPSMDALGLPDVVKSFTEYSKGLVLVTGETGSGKSTTLASLLDHINHTRNAHIITLEDPIEYMYESDRCMISQREIGIDTNSYADGIRACLREDPDIILIGEMRDLETIETALTAAETGHLVFATLHTNGASETMNRIVSSFDAGRQVMIRSQLAQTLNAVVSQKLLPKANGNGRVLAVDVMVVNQAIQNQIREGKAPQIESSVMTGKSWGCIPFDQSIQELLEKGLISSVTAAKYVKHYSDEEKNELKYRDIPFSSYGKR